jgi:hypothetical protein
MSSFNFIIPGNFSVTQNANLYIMDAPVTIETRKYHWTIDCGTTLNAMFSNRNYRQVSGNNEAYTANLTVDMTQVNTWLTTTGLTWDSTSSGGVATSVGIESGAQNFNLRLLEMAALEIFGHAKARAAISNESMFTNYHSHVTNHLSTTFNDQNIRNIFFEQYVDINRYYGSNDNQAQVLFNLANTSFYVFGNLNGEIVDATSINPGIFFKTNYSAPMRIQFRS